MTSYPLLNHATLDATFAWRHGVAVSARAFLRDVYALARALPAHRFVLPLTADRYRFAVGLGAAMLRGQITLLPPHRSPDVAARLRALCEDDLYILVDEPCDLDLAQTVYPRLEANSIEGDAVPRIEADLCVAWVFTSGSTGAPVPHAKCWGSLVENVDAAAAGLALDDAAAIVGTVPAQHMYGLESTVLLAFRGHATLSAERPFYPADIAQALAALPQPRMLVTAPFHLRALLEARIELPPVDRIVCATAPLSDALAREAEAAFGGSLVEIYGCTESGQLAMRRTSVDPTWTTFGTLSIVERDGVFFAKGGHLGSEVALADVLELDDAHHFRLVGRSTDMVNIAGKRTSIAHLNFHLNAIPGVRDGAFFAPEEPDAGDIARLVAFAVAPGLTPTQIVEALRKRIDSVFLPRPLLMVDALPRNATGKLPREALAAMATDQL